MKIALSGLHPNRQEKLITEVQKLWPKYVSPTKSIFDDEIEVDTKKAKIYKKLNDSEKDNFSRWYLLNEQYEKYKDQKYIIYKGSPIDLFVLGMTFRS